jgi:hypothetical protein
MCNQTPNQDSETSAMVSAGSRAATHFNQRIKKGSTRRRPQWISIREAEVVCDQMILHLNSWIF